MSLFWAILDLFLTDLYSVKYICVRIIYFSLTLNMTPAAIINAPMNIGIMKLVDLTSNPGVLKNVRNTDEYDPNRALPPDIHISESAVAIFPIISPPFILSNICVCEYLNIAPN